MGFSKSDYWSYTWWCVAIKIKASQTARLIYNWWLFPQGVYLLVNYWLYDRVYGDTKQCKIPSCLTVILLFHSVVFRFPQSLKIVYLGAYQKVHVPSKNSDTGNIRYVIFRKQIIILICYRPSKASLDNYSFRKNSVALNVCPLITSKTTRHDKSV